MTKISIVTSLYKSSAFIHEFYNRTLACLKQLNVDYEFIFVNDGSPDDSESKVQELTAIDKKVILISLSRNFGQYPAMFAGFNYTSGDYVFALDSDLEEKPEYLLECYKIMTDDPSVDVVYGIVEGRSGGFIRNNLGKLFHTFMDKFSDRKIDTNQAWLRMMKKDVVTSLIKFEEAETYVAGLYSLVGFKQYPLMITKQYKGHSSYSFSRRIQSAMNAIASFTSKPLVYIGLLGAGISILSFLALIILVVLKLFAAKYQAGWSSLIVSIWFVGGLNLFSLGIIGIYISKIFIQIKRRPLYIIKSITNPNR